MGNFCSSTPKIPVLLRTEIQKISSVNPSVRLAILLNNITGSIISCVPFAHDLESPWKFPEQTQHSQEALRKSSSSFGVALQHGDSQVIHIHGKHMMFSYYILNDEGYVLIMYSMQTPDMNPVISQIPDMSLFDENMYPILTNVSELVRQL